MRTVIRLLIIMSCFFRGFLVRRAVGLHAAENGGFSEARVTDAKHVLVGFRGCDMHDAAGFLMSATNPAGKPAEIIICCGWPFKGCTVRTP